MLCNDWPLTCSRYESWVFEVSEIFSCILNRDLGLWWWMVGWYILWACRVLNRVKTKITSVDVFRTYHCYDTHLLTHSPIHLPISPPPLPPSIHLCEIRYRSKLRDLYHLGTFSVKNQYHPSSHFNHGKKVRFGFSGNSSWLIFGEGGGGNFSFLFQLQRLKLTFLRLTPRR